MVVALMLITGVCWTLTYALIIRRGFQDRIYGMPIVALCANISWEFIFAFVEPHAWRQRSIDIVWLCFDAVIWYQVVRFGPAQFPGVSRRLFYAMFGLSQVIAFGMVLAITHEFEDWQGYYAAYGQSLLMSALFLSMLYARRSLAGQSMGIAVAKLVGTACASLAFVLRPVDHPDSVLLPFLYVACTVLDAIYVAAVYWFWRQERAVRTEAMAASPSTRSAAPTLTAQEGKA